MYVEEVSDRQEWENFLRGSPDGTFYHSLKWREVLQSSFPNSRAIYLTIKDENGRIVGVCPGFLLNSTGITYYESMPFSDYGGPVIARDCVKEASLSLRAFFQSYGSNMGIAYAKILFSDRKSAQVFESPLGHVSESRGVVEIDLKTTPSDLIWNRLFSRNRRRDIRRFERKGYQAYEARNKHDLRDFYALYYRNMKYVGVSPRSYRFMENAWNMLQPDSLRIWLVGKERPIGGIAVFKDERRTYGIYAGLDREHSSRYQVIPYLIWREIQRAEQEGYQQISLGGTPSDFLSRYHAQKTSLAGTFLQQQIVSLPLSSLGCVLMQAREKTSFVSKKIWKHLPTNLRRISRWRPTSAQL